MEIISEQEKYLDRLAKRVHFGTTWGERFLSKSIPLEERLGLIMQEVCRKLGCEEVPDVKIKVYRDKYDLADKVFKAHVGPLGLYTHYDKTIHLSSHDASDKIVAHEMARAVLHHLQGRKPDSEESLKAAKFARKDFEGQRGV